MSRAWMPLYIGDMLADTMHLNATETGIYIRLIMHAWQHQGCIPDDPEKLRCIAHASAFAWKRYCNVLTFFQKTSNGYTHLRVLRELKRFEEISNKRKAAALQKHTQSQSHSHLRSSFLSSSEPRAKQDNSALKVSETLLAHEAKTRPVSNGGSLATAPLGSALRSPPITETTRSSPASITRAEYDARLEERRKAKVASSDC